MTISFQNKGLNELFRYHPRRWQEYQHVYPVISRRSKGLSIGVNLNTDCVCNFDCVYCCVDTEKEKQSHKIDPELLLNELTQMLQDAGSYEFWQEAPFNQAPPQWQQLRDVAFSGNGEPTAVPDFPSLLPKVVDLVKACGHSQAKTVLITNGTLLHQARVSEAIDAISGQDLKLWIKLDAAHPILYQRINRSPVPLQRILDNIELTGKKRPITIQTMLIRRSGLIQSEGAREHYIQQLRQWIEAGVQIEMIQLYTTARQPRESWVKPLGNSELHDYALQINEVLPELKIETYGNA